RPAIYKTRAPALKAAASSKDGVRHWENVRWRVGFAPATSYKPRETSRCRRKCRRTCLSGRPCARARPGASSAFLKSDQDELGMLGSDGHRRRSTRCAECLCRLIRKG